MIGARTLLFGLARFVGYPCFALKPFISHELLLAFVRVQCMDDGAEARQRLASARCTVNG